MLSCSSRGAPLRHRWLWVPGRASLARDDIEFVLRSQGYELAFSRHQVPELCLTFHPPETQRAQGKPGADCTRGLLCE